EEHPPGLAPLLEARGFGPAGVEALRAATGVTSLDDVEAAGQDGRLAQALGPRRAQDLLAQLPALRNPIRSLRLKSAWETAALILDLLNDDPARPARVEVAGSARRMCEMVSDGLDLLAIPSGSPADLLDLVEKLPPVVRVVQRDAISSR